MMLTVLIYYEDSVVYLRPFNNHKEAIDHYCDLYGHLFNGATLELSSHTVIPLIPEEEIKEPFYVR